jgi:glycosyltransferase involved in cell wall biosynthesis
MKYGCPVITSNVSSLPEAGGDAAIYIDPENTKDIAEKMEKVLSDTRLRESMIKKGFVHVKKFSWEKTAEETLDVLQKLVD